MLGTGVYAETFNPPQEVKCSVTQVIPANANFFTGLGGHGPRVGEEIDLNLVADAITDLTFSKKGTIPLKQVDARLVKRTDVEPYQSYYEGTAKSITSDYIGLLTLYHGEKESSGSIQVLRKLFFGNMVLNEVQLHCTRTK
jgi:hypothetical protein